MARLRDTGQNVSSAQPPIPKRRLRLPRLGTGRLRRSTLVTLRWTAVGGQAITVLFVALILGYDFPFLACMLAIAISAMINFIVAATLPLDRRVGDLEAICQLGFDLFQLAVLIWLTGGMTNPFSLLFLAPVVTGATTLSRSVLIVLTGLAAGLSFALLFFALPLPWANANGFELPFIYAFAVWLALQVGTIFTSIYAWRSAHESRRMSEALAATEAVLAHEQKLSALGGLAAAAAHELGTPLATIQVTAKEMSRELPEKSPLGQDARLMLSQAQRCRDILQQLARRGDEGDMIHDQLSLDGLLEEASQPFLGLKGIGPTLEVTIKGQGEVPDIGRKAELLYGLKNFIENAMDFAQSRVEIYGDWSEDIITITIEDDGPGFDPTIRTRLGEPYVTQRNVPRERQDRRSGVRDRTQTQGDKESAGGLGLGVFIAKTLIERTGGHVKFGRATIGGAKITLTWPRASLS